MDGQLESVNSTTGITEKCPKDVPLHLFLIVFPPASLSLQSSLTSESLQLFISSMLIFHPVVAVKGSSL